MYIFDLSMRSLLLLTVLLTAVMSLTGCESTSEPATDEALRARADELAHRYIIVDGHIDVPYRLKNHYEDISQATEDGDFDYARARRGGLNAPFMSIYLPAEYQETGGGKALADSLIDMVEGFARQWPDKYAVATSTADVRRHFEEGLISLPMGMENGVGIEDDLANLQHFYDRGIRYITLTHSKNNLIGDSSYDTTRTWNGLSDYGRDVVREMNRLGIMVDVSHISDSTFYDVMAVTEAPVIASHSSVRHFTPDFERNMNDDMIQVLAENDGVIMINFGSSFISGDYQTKRDAAMEHVIAYMKENGLTREDEEARTYFDEYMAENVGYADVTDVADHIDHVVQLVGVDHVGLGSDFDGVGDSLPTGLKDVAAYPNLVYELLKRGYSDADVEKILGGNVLRVWGEVERIAREKQSV